MSADEIAFSETVDEALAAGFFSPAWLLARASLKQKFLIEGAIPERAITLIAGAPGEKKSWIAYAACLSVARGLGWLGFDAPEEGPGPVLVANFDNPTAELGRRFLRLGLRPEDPITFHTRDDVRTSDAMLRLPDRAQLLQTIVARLRPRLVVIDSLRQAHTVDENSSKEMAEVMAVLKSLTVHGAAVVVVHHTKKPGPKDDGLGALLSMRGSGEIAGSTDAAIVVIDDVAHWVKHRGWEIEDGAQDVAFAVEDDGDLTHVIAL